MIALLSSTTKLVGLDPVPAAFVMLMRPVVARLGTVALMVISSTTEKLGSTVPLKVTFVAPVKPVPVSVTGVPTGPLPGEKEVIVGVTVDVTLKLVSLMPALPPEVDTVIGPVVAPTGTVAVIKISESTLKLRAAVPLKLTCITAVKPLPVSVTTVPAGPLSGEKEAMVGWIPITKS